MSKTLQARAAAGDASAQFKVARRLWILGRRATKRQKLAAMKWYCSAAEGGHRDAQAQLASMLIFEESPFYDVAEGFRWLIRAAEQGHRGVQYFLGVQFATGEMVEADPKRALHWYRKAAAAGDAEAQYNIGTMYWEGEGVRKNAATARKWIRRAAKNGDYAAILLLASAYETGEFGFRVTAKQARYWQARKRRLDRPAHRRRR
jgi:TPR repeat protein